jgi:hypothetical protein
MKDKVCPIPGCSLGPYGAVTRVASVIPRPPNHGELAVHTGHFRVLSTVVVQLVATVGKPGEPARRHGR